MPTANGYWQYSSRIDMDCNDKILDMLHTKRNIITNVLYIHCTCNMCRKTNCYQLLRKDMDWNLHEKKKSHIILERHVVKYFPLHSFDQLTLIKKKDMDLLDISLCNFVTLPLFLCLHYTGYVHKHPFYNDSRYWAYGYTL